MPLCLFWITKSQQNVDIVEKLSKMAMLREISISTAQQIVELQIECGVGYVCYLSHSHIA